MLPITHPSLNHGIAPATFDTPGPLQVAPLNLPTRITCLASVFLTLVVGICTIPCLVAQWRVSPPYGSMRTRLYLLSITLVIVFADIANNFVLAFSLLSEYEYGRQVFYFIRSLTFASILGPLLVAVLHRTCGILLVNHPMHRHVILSFGIFIAVGLTMLICTSILKETLDLYQEQLVSGSARVWDKFHVSAYGTFARVTYPIVVIFASWWSLSIAFPNKIPFIYEQSLPSHHRFASHSLFTNHKQSSSPPLNEESIANHFPPCHMWQKRQSDSYLIPTTSPPLMAYSLPPFLALTTSLRRQQLISVHVPPPPTISCPTPVSPTTPHFTHTKPSTSSQEVRSLVSPMKSVSMECHHSYSSPHRPPPTLARYDSISTSTSNTRKVSTVKLPLTITFRWLNFAVIIIWFFEGAIALIDRSILHPLLRSTLCSLVLASAVLMETAFILIFRLQCRRATDTEEGAFYSFRCRVLRWIHGSQYNADQARHSNPMRPSYCSQNTYRCPRGVYVVQPVEAQTSDNIPNIVSPMAQLTFSKVWRAQTYQYAAK